MNKKEFEKTAERYYRPIFNYCLVRLYVKEAADDCTQEVFLALFRRFDELEKDNIRAWLYRTADNVMRNYRRKFSSCDQSDELPDIAVEDEYSVEMPFEGILTEEETAMLTEHYINGYTIAEVAEKRKKTPAAIYKTFQRIKERLLRNVYHRGDSNEKKIS